MKSIRIAAAQTSSIPADISANVAIHLAFIAVARHAGVDVLVFPELSLTGYELPIIGDRVLTPDDERLAPIRALAAEAAMTIVVGAPVAGPAPGLPAIGAIHVGLDGAAATYRKQYLHAGEERYAQPGPPGAHCRTWHGHAAALAICADTGQHKHAAAAAGAGAELYLASVLVSEGGYAADAAILQGYAREFKMGVLMANHGAPSGGYVCAGRSAFWTPDGELLVAAEGAGNYLVIADGSEGRWKGRVLAVGV